MADNSLVSRNYVLENLTMVNGRHKFPSTKISERTSSMLKVYVCVWGGMFLFSAASPHSRAITATHVHPGSWALINQIITNLLNFSFSSERRRDSISFFPRSPWKYRIRKRSRWEEHGEAQKAHFLSQMSSCTLRTTRSPRNVP